MLRGKAEEGAVRRDKDSVCVFQPSGGKPGCTDLEIGVFDYSTQVVDNCYSGWRAGVETGEAG
jgi:hypothetical protein